MKADIVLKNANVITMNPAQPRAQAIAIKDEKIVKVGSNVEIEPWIGKKTKMMDLNGKTVLPGLIDTHIHVADFGRVLTWLDLKGTESIEILKSMVKKRAQNLLKGKWVIGRGWNQVCFAEKRLPTRADLDEVSPDNPVVLYHQCEQMCVVNSVALALAGVTNPKGILSGDATNLVWQKVPEPSEDELLEATSQACEAILRAGVTSVHWIMLSPIEIPIIKKLHEQNRLPIRVYLIVPENLLDNAIEAGLNRVSDGMLKVGATLVFSDGYLAARTAALAQPYNDAPVEKGKLLCTPDDMTAIAEKTRKANMQLVIHAVGDKAVKAALETLEKTSTSRPRLEQAAVLNPELIEGMKKQQVLVSVQPMVVASEFSVWSAVNRLGSERALWLFPIKTLLESGIRVLGGSDCPMELLNPMLSIQAAVVREAFSEQRVSVEEALLMYTIDAAYGSFEENKKGSIQAGKLADIIIVSDDPMSVLPEKIGNISPEIIVLGGQVTYLEKPK